MQAVLECDAVRDVLGLSAHNWTATELRRLPAAERDAVMSAAALLAEAEYRNDPELTAFEAFGEDDLYGLSSSAATR